MTGDLSKHESIPPSSREVGDVLRPLRHVLAALMRSEALGRGDVDAALAQVTEVAAEVLRVGRASVWVMPPDQSRIECVDLYEATALRHSRGTVIERVSVPRYFRALDEARSIAAHDARSDERTAEFASGYLVPNDITAMLDAPVLLRGELVGIVCHEHLGSRRRWHFWEELLAATLADFVAMVLGASEHVAQASELAAYRLHLEELVEDRTAELRQTESNLRTIFEGAPVALLLVRASDHVVISANSRATELFEEPLGLEQQRCFLDFDLENALSKLSTKRDLEGCLARLRTATGREIWAELSWRALEMNDEPCLVVGVRDVTDKKIADERLHLLATTDPLTGALNRHSFFEVAEREIARSARYAHPLAMVMFDADHFKQLNDRGGHAAGDEALRTIVRVARRELRRVDTLARVGGEEFAVVLPETSIEAATRVTERLRQAIADEPLPDGERVTISAGVVAWRKDDSLDATLGRADNAMYEAKHAGRNRVHSSP